MIAFILLFFPAVLATGIYETLQKTSLSRKQWLYRYCSNVLLINLICFAFKQFILRSADAPLYTADAGITPHAAMNFLVMALPTAVVLSFLQVLLSKHTKADIEETK